MQVDQSREEMNLLDLLKEEVLHIFGYGSLVWKPDFDYDSIECGIIKGLRRVFWQKSKHHRGTEENPGRVLTAIEDEDSIIHGVTYHVTGEERKKKALESLGIRENLLGGYNTMLIDFYPATNAYTSPVPSCKAVLYVALPQNVLYAGPQPEEEIARIVSNCAGVSGPNSEYILKLTEFMKIYFPSVEEDHLYKIESWVKYYDAQNEQIRSSKLQIPSKFNKVNASKCSHLGNENILECSGKLHSNTVTSSFKVDSRSVSPVDSGAENIFGEKFGAEDAKNFYMEESKNNLEAVSVKV